jgi:hypothetical protein
VPVIALFSSLQKIIAHTELWFDSNRMCTSTSETLRRNDYTFLNVLKGAVKAE